MNTAQVPTTALPLQTSLYAVRARRSEARIRLFVADSHALFRHALRLVLEMRGGFTMVGEASDGRDALSLIEELQPDVALVDLGLPSLNGLEVAKRVRRTGARTKMVVLASRMDEPLLLMGLDKSVAGYLTKEADFDELTLALRKVHSGYGYFTPAMQTQLIGNRTVDKLGALQGAQRDVLTSRERELLQLIAEGYTNREIADQLCLSVKTVEAHKANICCKLNVRGQAGLVRHAIQAGVIGVVG